MKIFGLGYGGFHDSNVAIMENGEVISAISEERLSGVKKDGRFPTNAIKALQSKDVKILCVSNLADEAFYKEYQKANIVPRESIIALRKKVFDSITSFAKSFDQVFFFSHQECHASSAFYFSEFKRSLVVTWDAGSISEPWNYTVSIGNGTKLDRIQQSTNGLPALNYAAITALLGFRPERHEGKITGLAAHGKLVPAEVEKVRTLLADYAKNSNLLSAITEWKNAGSVDQIPTLEVDKNKAAEIYNNLGISKENLAAIIQNLTEQAVLTTLQKLRAEYPEEENICLAGGLFANVLINKKIKELGFKNIYIHPAMGDDGLALGACAHYLMSQNIPFHGDNSVFWGPAFTNEEVEATILKYNLVYHKSTTIEKDIAERLSKGQIVARCKGKMEYGPRSLGNRSILASATTKEINDSLNKKLRRTEFMPFAPITLEENKDIMYKNTFGLEKAIKYMTIAVDCTEQCKKENPAIVHIDGTARPQIVGTDKPSLRLVLQEYQKLTGLSALINTSFNMHEGPIVCTPENAITTFVESQLDCLAIEDFIIVNQKKA